eukprot:gene9477-21252_t
MSEPAAKKAKVATVYTEIAPKGTSTAPIQCRAEVFALKKQMVANRRWFHAHPEPSFKEYETAKKVVEILKEYGVDDVKEGVGKTGVVGLIIGGAGEGPCVALRADMDALNITETAEVEYKSQNEGWMHACGHD